MHDPAAIDPAKPAPFPSRQRCDECGTPLDVHQAARGRYCDSPGCGQAQRLKQALQHQQEQEIPPLNDRELSFAAARAMARHGRLKLNQAFNLAIVPWNPTCLGPPDPTRIAEFEACLDALLLNIADEVEAARLAGSRIEPGCDNQGDTVDPDIPLGGEACTTCRGHCCRQGQTHAFMTEDTLRSYFQRYPEAGIEECREAYLSVLGDDTCVNSCIFHGAEGCLLPRTIRASTCNTWNCRGVGDLHREVRAGKQAITVISACDMDGPRRLRVVETDTGRFLGECEYPSATEEGEPQA